MSCTRPNYVTYANGQIGRFGGKLTQYVIDNAPPDLEIVPVPCGKCPGCRLDRGKKWADRMLLEFESPPDNMPRRTALFVTLTYDDDHLPRMTCTDGSVRGTLCKADPQLFLKRLRKYFAPKRIRFYNAGEYGDQTFRPHYHQILFGLSLSDFPDAVLYSHDFDQDTDLYVSPTFDRIWSHGSVKFSVASYRTFSYVARYVLKKQFGSDFGAAWYRGRVPPFSTCSRRPGIGSDYFDDDFDVDIVSISDGLDVHKISAPRVNWEKKYLTNPDECDIMKSQKRERAAGIRDLTLAGTDLGYLAYLRSCERNLKEKTRSAFERSKL